MIGTPRGLFKVFQELKMTNSSPKAVSGQRYPCPASAVCDLSWGGAGQRTPKVYGAKTMDFRPELLFFFLARNGSFCLDLGHIAWIWAIWQNRWTDGWMDRFPLCSTGLRSLWGRCPATPQLKSHTTQAGHGYRWPLTAFGLLLHY